MFRASARPARAIPTRGIDVGLRRNAHPTPLPTTIDARFTFDTLSGVTDANFATPFEGVTFKNVYVENLTVFAGRTVLWSTSGADLSGIVLTSDNTNGGQAFDIAFAKGGRTMDFNGDVDTLLSLRRLTRGMILWGSS